MPVAAPKNVLEILKRLAMREPAGQGRLPMAVAWASTRGLVRESNQDRLIIGLARSGLAFAVLADGMGGMKEGARAAAMTVAATASYCVEHQEMPLDRLLDRALHAANEDVYRMLRGEGGATAVVAAWKSGTCYAANAGDARAYRIPASGRAQFEQLSSDDTLSAELERLGRRPSGAPVAHGGLMQFIGVGPDLLPHVFRVPEDSRALLLTTDGVHVLPRVFVDWLVYKGTQLQSLPDHLVQVSEWGGGRDNATAIVIGLQNGGPGEPVGESDFWIAGERVAIAEALDRRVSSGGDALRPSAETAATTDSQTQRQKKSGGSRKPQKSRTRRTKPRETHPKDAHLPLADFTLPSQEGVELSRTAEPEEASSGSLATESPVKDNPPDHEPSDSQDGTEDTK